MYWFPGDQTLIYENPPSTFCSLKEILDTDWNLKHFSFNHLLIFNLKYLISFRNWHPFWIMGYNYFSAFPTTFQNVRGPLKTSRRCWAFLLVQTHLPLSACVPGILQTRLSQVICKCFGKREDYLLPPRLRWLLYTRTTAALEPFLLPSGACALTLNWPVLYFTWQNFPAVPS